MCSDIVYNFFTADTTQPATLRYVGTGKFELVSTQVFHLWHEKVSNLGSLVPLKTILFMLIHGKDDDDDNN